MDVFISSTVRSHGVYINDGTGHFTFLHSLDVICSTGGDWGDVDNDGDLDLLVILCDGVQLYINQGNCTFSNFSFI